MPSTPAEIILRREASIDCRTERRSDSRLPPSLSRVTPSAVSEHFSELLGCPISRSLTASCVGLELRPLPSPGITRLPRYYEPPRHPSAPGLSLTGLRLIIPDHALGLPVLRALSLCTCCRHYPGAAAGCIPRSSHPAVSAFPGRVTGSACTSTFSRLARRALALRPAHSRGHQFVTRYPKASDISSPPCLLRLLPAGANRRVGLAPTGKRRLVTAHTRGGRLFALPRRSAVGRHEGQFATPSPSGVLRSVSQPSLASREAAMGHAAFGLARPRQQARDLLHRAREKGDAA